MTSLKRPRVFVVDEPISRNKRFHTLLGSAGHLRNNDSSDDDDKESEISEDTKINNDEETVEDEDEDEEGVKVMSRSSSINSAIIYPPSINDDNDDIPISHHINNNNNNGMNISSDLLTCSHKQTLNTVCMPTVMQHKTFVRKIDFLEDELIRKSRRFSLGQSSVNVEAMTPKELSVILPTSTTGNPLTDLPLSSAWRSHTNNQTNNILNIQKTTSQYNKSHYFQNIDSNFPTGSFSGEISHADFFNIGDADNGSLNSDGGEYKAEFDSDSDSLMDSST